MSYDRQANLKERIRRRALLDSAVQYIKDLPGGLSHIVDYKIGKISLLYGRPKPLPHAAYYWPCQQKWRYIGGLYRTEPGTKGIKVAKMDAVARSAYDAEDFVRQFALGAHIHNGNPVAIDAQWYEMRGPEAVMGAVNRGEFNGWSEPAHQRHPFLGDADPDADRDDRDAPARPTTTATNPSGGTDGPGDPRRTTTGADQARRGGEPPGGGSGPAVQHGTDPGYNRGPVDESEVAKAAVPGPQDGLSPQQPRSRSHKRSASPGDEGSPRKAFIIRGARVFAQQADAVDRLLAPLEPPVSEATRRFFCHVLLAGAQTHDGGEKRVPVSAKLVEREFGIRKTSTIWDPLWHGGLIIAYRPNKESGLSRTFSVQPGVRDVFLAAVPRARDVGAIRFADVVTGRLSKAKGDRRYLTDEGGHSYPVLIKGALSSLYNAGCPVDLAAAEAHVDTLSEDFGRAFHSWTDSGSPVGTDEDRVWKSAQARWRADRYCMNTVLRAVPVVGGDGVTRYTPTYSRKVQSSGRLTEVGGLQNCSRAMKHAALSGLRISHDVRNYDLVSSQAWGLVQLFEDDGVDASWLRAYLAADKAAYAELAFGDRSGATVALWKACVFALFMGATLPATTASVPPHKLTLYGPAHKTPEIAVAIRNAFGDGRPTAVANARLTSFRSVVGPFLAARDAWHDGLESRAAGDLTFAAPGRGGRYVMNAAGMTFKVDGEAGFPLRSKLAAHLLQGLEAAFIHRLTALAPEYGFSAVNNQHDGLITVGEVPAAAVDQAKADTGLRYATLEEKRYRPDLPVPGLG